MGRALCKAHRSKTLIAHTVTSKLYHVTMFHSCCSSLQLSDGQASHVTDVAKTPSTPQRQSKNTMVPPKQYSVRIDGQHEPHTDTKQSEQHEQTNWISGIITCLKPVWSFIGRAALEEKLKGEVISVERGMQCSGGAIRIGQLHCGGLSNL